MNELVRMSREVAERIPGSKAFSHGGLEFSRRGLPARVEFVPYGNHRVWTEFHADLKGVVRTSLRVRTAGFLHDLLNFFGKHDVLVGDPVFDALFDIDAPEPGFAQKVLRPSTRALLRSLSLHGGIFWRVSTAGFVLRLDAAPERAADLEGWMGFAFQLLDAVPGTEAVDQVRFERARIAIDEDSVCQVCGGSLLLGLTVRCATCATPHHRDCWDFNRRCSTFACGETRFL